MARSALRGGYHSRARQDAYNLTGQRSYYLIQDIPPLAHAEQETAISTPDQEQGNHTRLAPKPLGTTIVRVSIQDTLPKVQLEVER